MFFISGIFIIDVNMLFAEVVFVKASHIRQFISDTGKASKKELLSC